jgi:hypothetical protein
MFTKDKYLSNLLYFEASSMRELYDSLKSWQEENHQVFFRLNIQQESGKVCCIALVIVEGLGQVAMKTEEGWSQKLLAKGYWDAMKRFERKALRIIVSENNIGADINYVTDDIAPEKILAIQSKLKICTTAEEIKAVFREELIK